MHFFYISTYLENTLVIEWEISNLLVVYIEKDLADNIDIEIIISYNDFKI